MEVEKGIGQILKVLRVANDYTLKDIEEKANLSVSYISELENGKKSVTVKVLEKYANLFEIEMPQIMALVEFYESVGGTELKKYQLTLIEGLKLFSDKEGKKIREDRNHAINAVLKIARHANCMTIVEASKVSGVSNVFINKLENNQRNARKTYLEKLAIAYKLRLPQLFEITDYYQNLDTDEETAFRHTLIKILETIENNRNETTS